MQLVIVCPLFHGGGSGVATYYRLLAHSLMEKGVAVSIISDREKGEFAGQYIGLFPVRCGRDRRPLRDRLAYGWQNLTYTKIVSIIRSQNPDALLVHSSFYNFPGMFNFFMKRIRKEFPDMMMVVDVRDNLLSKRKIRLLNLHDKIIGCSLNVVNRLRKNGAENHRIVHIPVLQERLTLDEKIAEKVLQRFQLSAQGYIFYAGLIKEAKGIGLLLQAYCEYLQRDGFKLVLAGHNKCTEPKTSRLLRHPGVYFIGNQDRSTVLALMSNAAVCVNLSSSEGMPRASLEPIGLGCPVLLPRGIPEFVQYCPDFIVEQEQPETVAKQIRRTVAKKTLADYPIENHYPENLIPRYLELFSARGASLGQ